MSVAPRGLPLPVPRVPRRWTSQPIGTSRSARGETEKIGWFSLTWGGSRLTPTGKRLHGRGSFSQRFRATPGAGFYPSGISIPTPGCWQLTPRTQGWSRQGIVVAVDRSEGRMRPTARQRAGAGQTRACAVRNLCRLGLENRGGRCLIYAGGRTPDGGNTKVPWRSSWPGGLLELRGAQLDGVGALRETKRLLAIDRRGPESWGWLFTVRVSGRGVIVVARVASF